MSDGWTPTTRWRPAHAEGDPWRLCHDRRAGSAAGRHRSRGPGEQEGGSSRDVCADCRCAGGRLRGTADEYPDGSEASSDDDVALDVAPARLIQDWYLLTDASLRVIAPRETPILWPEHFEVAILLDNTSYGASPGDGFHAMPYAYVSTREHGDSDFWNAPFGAFQKSEQMKNVDDLVSFWRAAQGLLKAHG